MILLSFDTEECDLPLEHGAAWHTLRDGMPVSVYGTERILRILAAEGVHATFFVTANFAEHAPDLVRRIDAAGHEIACHGCDHWRPAADDPQQSRRRVEAVVGHAVSGYRQPRMFPVSDDALTGAGFRYDSSLNPAFVPGRYMHLSMPRTAFRKPCGLWEIPAGVSPTLRIPLFWLAIHNFPMPLYLALVRRAVRRYGYFMTYCHPWEFYPLRDHPEMRVPYIIRRGSGSDMQRRFTHFVRQMKGDGHRFLTFTEFLNNINDSDIKCK